MVAGQDKKMVGAVGVKLPVFPLPGFGAHGFRQNLENRAR
jgi:hypothetical protein